MKYRWTVAPTQPALAELLSGKCDISPLLAQCLLNRGLSEPEEINRFLEPRLKNLQDPFLIPDMATAVDRLFTAREQQECVVIFGDYDVDGVTSTTLLLEVFKTLGWKVNFYLPHRFDEGYGLSQDGVLNCLEKFPVELLLAVDCGSTATATIRWLREKGIDTIVLDHHQVASPSPPAVALVNPQRAAPHEPSFRELCSVGLAFKLVHALIKRGRELGIAEAENYDLRSLLDLVALGTIADIVPLTGENRILVSTGLKRINTSTRPGLVALKEVARTSEEIKPHEVGFQLAPRLNAAGRMENATEALELLISDDPEDARRIAESLDSRNRERQTVERNISDEATSQARSRFDPARDYVIVESGLYWHIGVVGIVASRVLREFYRPTFIIGGEGQEWRGSGRSIEGFDLAAALNECDDLLLRHGGHAMAAGITVHPDRIDEFRERLNEIARRTISPELLLPPLRLDCLAQSGELTLDSLNELGRLLPTGQSNPNVKLYLTNVTLARAPRRIGHDGRHVKLQVTDGRHEWDAIWWEGGKEKWPVGTFDLAFTPEINEYKNQTRVQLRVHDWRTSNQTRST